MLPLFDLLLLRLLGLGIRCLTNFDPAYPTLNSSRVVATSLQDPLFAVISLEQGSPLSILIPTRIVGLCQQIVVGHIGCLCLRSQIRFVLLRKSACSRGQVPVVLHPDRGLGPLLLQLVLHEDGFARSIALKVDLIVVLLILLLDGGGGLETARRLLNRVVVRSTILVMVHCGSHAFKFLLIARAARVDAHCLAIYSNIALFKTHQVRHDPVLVAQNGASFVA